MSMPAPTRPDPESNKELLRALERDREQVLTEQEYRQMRGWILGELERGPQLQRSHLATFFVVGGVCLGLGLLGLIGFWRKIVPDLTLPLASGGALLLWGYLLRSYWKDVRDRSGRSVRQRLLELQELRAEKLLTQEEFDRLYAAIMMARQGGGKEKG